MSGIPQEFTAYYESPVGTLEISGTEEYLTSILFVEAQKRPSPKFRPSEFVPEVVKVCIQQLKEYFAGNRKDFDLIFKHKGTDFQVLVWHTLETIPYGKTISYLELSRRIGNEKAIRAVGTTNGNNKFTIVVPCHRVIGSNGSLVGYGGDLWRKKWLLEHELKYSGGFQTKMFE
ncbi:methylated-DNA-[protein]-cysteine S-methyltransferase [Pseudarcicella hirudinis]|uniref:Methylated-DNA--protein-cysteine methyltransferase n=1 Tax=Pseudarcicella hirudinis TaxID=1079859 RepID=A0A1I5RMK6_9BACT|nr:methylated-DNA--[protein]-cysteine S-methyltransferase [Pseudarcicella hirudinis]SFP59723.1 methylated-DNA-[protein]-cysteine S-methyltransferase [Pseudarcicella hirudinis]